MTAVVTIANQKGGVSKTTTARHLAYFLDEMGKRVLVIDNDHQGNLTQYFGFHPIEVDEELGSMYHVYAGERPLPDILLGATPNIMLAPASLSLAHVGPRLATRVDADRTLKLTIDQIKEEYDVVLIDCGPNLERLLVNALMASQYVLIPTKTDAMSVSGIPALVETISAVQTSNPALGILGILPTIYHANRTADSTTLAELREQAEAAGVRVFDPIPSATNYDKAGAEGKPVFELFPDTPGRAEYNALAEVISHL